MLKDYFSHKPGKNTGYEFSNKFTHKSEWIPPWNSITDETKSSLERITQETNKIINPISLGSGIYRQIRNKYKDNNLSKNELMALRQLKNNNNIVIKPADKGGAIVVMDRSLYLAEGQRQLHNTAYYKRLSDHIYPDTIPIINNVLNKLYNKGYITDKQLIYLSSKQDDVKARQFYLLPKIHKDRKKWPNDRMPEGRPIVSDCGSETHRVSEYIDYFLQPLATSHEAYIKDTYDFVDKIRNSEIDKTDILVTGDVTALYTNMRIDIIMHSIKEIFSEFPATGRPDEELLELLHITLTRNDFAFADKIFQQVCGTAMGKRYAPSLANIYLRKFDRLAKQGFHIKPKIYWRYLDDIYLIWPGTVENLKLYEQFLNSLIPGITVKLIAKNNIIEYLDTRTYKYFTSDNRCILKTKPYFKSTDTHQLLHKKSYHPQHTFRGLLKSQFIRFKRISSFKIEYDEACNILKRVLVNRGYSSRFFRTIKNNTWKDEEVELRKKKSEDSSTNELLPIITMYDEVGPKLNRIWKQIIVENDQFINFRTISAYKIHKNLRKHLVHSTLISTTTTTLPKAEATIGCRRCTNIKCKACNYITESKIFTSSHYNRSFTLYHNFNCKSANIIYVITCRYCKLQYVGETARPLGQRITDHVSAIKLHKDTPIGLHFNLPGHLLKHFSIMAIEQINNYDKQTETRRLREIRWQNTLGTFHPIGINNYTSNK